MPISNEKLRELLANGCILKAMGDMVKREVKTYEELGGDLIWGDPSHCSHGREFGCGSEERVEPCIPHEGAWFGFLSQIGEVFGRASYLGKPQDPMERVIQRLTRHLPETDRKVERITVITADFRLQEMPIQEAAKEILGLADMFKQHLSKRRAANLKVRR